MKWADLSVIFPTVGLDAAIRSSASGGNPTNSASPPLCAYPIHSIHLIGCKNF
jgi:hypothetical protein